MQIIGFLSDFADQGVLLPIEFLVFLGLLCLGQRRNALMWALVMTGASGVLLVLKLWFERCGVPVHRVLYSPSGHTMGGTLVYGGLLALFCRPSVLFVAGTVALALLFGFSRVDLGVHTTTEVIVGGLIGLVSVFALRTLLGRTQTGSGRLSWWGSLLIIAPVCATVVLLHGWRLGAEGWIQLLARRALGSVMCH